MANRKIIGAHVPGSDGIFKFDPKKTSANGAYRIVMVDETGGDNRMYYMDLDGAVVGQHLAAESVTYDKIAASDIDLDLSSVSGSDDTLASAKAIKTYVDAQLTAQDLDFAGDSGGAQSVDLDSQSLTIAGGTGLSSVGSAQTITLNLDNTAVSAGSYGLASQVAQIAVDAQGRITGASNVTISIASSAVTDFAEAVQDVVGGQFVTNGSHSGISAAYDDSGDGAIDLSLTTVNSTTSSQGGAAKSLTITAGGDGRITSIAEQAIAIAHTQVTDFDAGVQANRLDQMSAPTSSVSMSSQKITSLANGTASTDAVNKSQLDSAVQGIDPVQSCQLLADSNVNVGSPTNSLQIDGVAVGDGKRVLLQNQSTASENGIYVYATAGSGSLSRPSDFDESYELNRSPLVYIEEGNNYNRTSWMLKNTGSISVGSDALTFELFQGVSDLAAGDGLARSASQVLSVELATGSGLDFDSGKLQIADLAQGSLLVGDGSSRPVAFAKDTNQHKVLTAGSTSPAYVLIADDNVATGAAINPAKVDMANLGASEGVALPSGYNGQAARSIALDFSGGLSALGAAPADADLMAVYDDDATTHKKVTFANVKSGISSGLAGAGLEDNSGELRFKGLAADPAASDYGRKLAVNASGNYFHKNSDKLFCFMGSFQSHMFAPRKWAQASTGASAGAVLDKLEDEIQGLGVSTSGTITLDRNDDSGAYQPFFDLIAATGAAAPILASDGDSTFKRSPALVVYDNGATPMNTNVVARFLVTSIAANGSDPTNKVDIGVTRSADEVDSIFSTTAQSASANLGSVSVRMGEIVEYKLFDQRGQDHIFVDTIAASSPSPGVMETRFQLETIVETECKDVDWMVEIAEAEGNSGNSAHADFAKSIEMAAITCPSRGLYLGSAATGKKYEHRIDLDGRMETGTAAFFLKLKR